MSVVNIPDVRQLEVQIQKSRSAMATLEDKLRVANDVIARQNADLAEAVAARKAAVREYEVAETEANELHEFLQVSVKGSIQVQYGPLALRYF